MAWSAVSSAITTIAKLVADEATYLWGVEEQVDRLETEMKWMQCFLRDAEARRGESATIRMWVADIRELAYDAEDVVETFALKYASKRKTCVSKYACFMKDGWMLHKTRSDIEKIISRIADLRGRLQTYGIKEQRVDRDQASSSLSSSERRRPFPHIVEDNIVGFDDIIKELVSVVTDEERDCRVVSICGMGGLGKTTLAKKIYHHSHVRDQFSHLAWVYVSQQCQRRKVWEDILSGLISPEERGRKLGVEELAQRLFDFLEDNKCLVVLDDIWSTQAWDSISAAFPTRETRSKILLTSRNREVALKADSRGYLHDLEGLKDEDSWELFQKIAFPSTHYPDGRVDAKLGKLGKEMIKHCAGLPLAITVLGGLLKKKHSSNEWQVVYENVKSYIKKGQEKGEGTEDVLALSYDDLPPHLKPCFLYFSHFPEDYKIHAYRLIQLWVAEGIVSSEEDEGNGGDVIEDVAENYLNELVERCMIQGEERNAVSGKIKTCRLHDLMRELCLSKAREENFLYIFDRSNVNEDGNCLLSSTAQGVRRVAAHTYLHVQSIKNRHLRSLLHFDKFLSIEDYLPLESEMRCLLVCCPCRRWRSFCADLAMTILILFKAKSKRTWKYIFNTFKLLRVLDFEGNSQVLGSLPKDIGNLIHLRFLNLRRINVNGLTKDWWELPSSLGNLRCLQTLDLRVDCERKCILVPDVIWKMEELRHLYLPQDCKDGTKLKLGTLKNLQTLVNFNTKNCYVKDLLSMGKLRELEIYGSFHIEDLKEDLDKNPPIIASKCLRSLSINEARMDPRHVTLLLSNCVNLCEFSSFRGLGKLPDYHHFPSDIAYINLEGSHSIYRDPMPTLEKLQNLRVLKIGDGAYQGKKLVCSAQRFLRLDSLSLKGLANLEEWEVQEGAMPALRSLEIALCQRLEMLPEGLKFITTLQTLKIEKMPNAFRDKLVEGGEDFYKVHHVPSIVFHKCYSGWVYRSPRRFSCSIL